ncbi:serine/threonine protein kinase [Aeromicrobium chenweiae]|uniref:non-specific serine/threonine protein kinase n=1 Tax=Aeromicrobium chenweiae TaxID=2079793 RepID=A0A2S0WI75_9ACTN|nr:serine/threonine-protein kinase [Aeromicrobium chenweiae]AWB91028.1 serine/threonine protein kinase [Aeromicrobium chenweiae]TGN31932.1 serine/threonine protein kinase [Aeromicrobium chenweiae]
MNEILNERYELGDVIGSGGMGAVYRATDLRLGRVVAIKILRGGVLADEVARSRMRSEASLAASINHPGVAQVFDFEEDRSANGGLSFIVMELIEGQSLSQILREQGVLPAEQVLSVIKEVAEGLDAAHRVGVVHRDLKPSNVMLTASGRAVLVDFGIAQTLASDPVTDTGVMVGTVEYMSPEQARGRPATSQSDLYALGVVAYRCLTGTSPFRRDSQIATALAHLHDDLPTPPSTVPVEVDQLIRSLTTKEPASRPPDAAAVALEAGRIRSVVLSQAFLGFRSLWPPDPAVPNVVGMEESQAKAEIREAGMDVSMHRVDVPGEVAGHVVDQKPEGGRPGWEADPVTLSVVSGKVRVSPETVIGTTYAEASAALHELGFEVRRNNVVQTDNIGVVVAIDKSGRIPIGSTITLSVALPPHVTLTSSEEPTAPGSPKSHKGDARPWKKGRDRSKGKKAKE